MLTLFPKNSLSTSASSQGKFFFLLATLATGCWLLAPHLQFQPYLSQGDHGRELYAAQQILRGDIPYRDFYWNYGPLPLYYYAFCFKILGVSINSVLAGRALLNLLSGIIIFQSLALFIPFEFAYLGAVWFWFFNPDFHYTYCYTGGITALLGLAYALILYLKNPKPKYLNVALALVIALFFIKVNIGGTALVGFLISLAVIDLGRIKAQLRTFLSYFLFALVGIPLLVFLGYLSFVYTLPRAVIDQCFPFLPHPVIHTNSAHNYSTPSALFWWMKAQFLTTLHSLSNFILAVLLFLSVGLTIHSWRQKDSDAPLVRQTIIACLILVIFYFLNLVEFLLSGIPYRAAWAAPFGFLLLFLFLGLGLRSIHRFLQIALIVTLASMIFTQQIFYQKRMKDFERAGKVFVSDRGHVICANGRIWNQTVNEATRYLQEHLTADETFFAVPYEPLYYFLTQRTAPTRQYTIFTPFAVITPEMEGQIIADLESHHVNYILLSNRSLSSEFQYGQLGVDTCPLMMRYIQQHFKEVAAFGDWDTPAQWVKGHAVKILKRVEVTRQINFR